MAKNKKEEAPKVVVKPVEAKKDEPKVPYWKARANK